MSTHTTALEAFSRLLNIVDELRVKCPWDKKQTLQSLRHLTIEETYELCDALLENNTEEIKKELGDLLLHILSYAKIGSETGAFDITNIANTLCEKLISRHPHIYGDATAESEKEVLQNWENLKLKEGKKSILEGVPKSLPALVKAFRIQEKVAAVGFDFPTPEEALKKVDEEWAEFQHEVVQKNPKAMEAEFGDLLFSMCNYARLLNINPENALERTNKKFLGRFQSLESEATKENKKLSEMTLQEMDIHWENAKKNHN